MQELFAQEIEDAIQKEKQMTADRMAFLETQHSQLVDKLRNLQPVLSDFVDSYICLQTDVAQFPKLINKTVISVTKEVCYYICTEFFINLVSLDFIQETYRYFFYPLILT